MLSKEKHTVVAKFRTYMHYKCVVYINPKRKLFVMFHRFEFDFFKPKNK